jgi:aspartate/methionine/tyrosine aminotransferase
MQENRMQVAEAISRLGTETAFGVGGRARALEAQGRSIIHLEIGEPDFPTAPHIIEAAHEAMLRGETHYGPPLGLPETREAIAEHLAQRGIPADPARIAVAPGAKPLVTFTIMATVSPGDEVILPDPSFPIYESMVRYLGATPVPLVLRQELGFGFKPGDLLQLASPRTRLIIVNTPQNPSGGVFPLPQLEAVAAAAQRSDAYVLSDEVYSRIIYDGQHHSIAALPGMADRTVVVDGMSKAYAMTGWRLGYAHLPAPLVPVIERLLINTVSCTPAFSQRAIIAALTGPQDAVEAMRQEFERRKEYLVRALRSIEGVECADAAGAFYLFPDVSAFGSSAELANRLLEEAGVAVLDGRAFGTSGEGHLRLSYANSMSNLEEAVRRIRGFLDR